MEYSSGANANWRDWYSISGLEFWKVFVWGVMCGACVLSHFTTPHSAAQKPKDRKNNEMAPTSNYERGRNERTNLQAHKGSGKRGTFAERNFAEAGGNGVPVCDGGGGGGS